MIGLCVLSSLSQKLFGQIFFLKQILVNNLVSLIAFIYLPIVLAIVDNSYATLWDLC
jgi:hypothetical protein